MHLMKVGEAVNVKLQAAAAWLSEHKGWEQGVKREASSISLIISSRNKLSGITLAASITIYLPTPDTSDMNLRANQHFTRISSLHFEMERSCCTSAVQTFTFFFFTITALNKTFLLTRLGSMNLHLETENLLASHLCMHVAVCFSCFRVAEHSERRKRCIFLRRSNTWGCL